MGALIKIPYRRWPRSPAFSLMKFLYNRRARRLVFIWRFAHLTGATTPIRSDVFAMRIHKHELERLLTDHSSVEPRTNRSEEQHLIWKGALMMLCLALFVLVMWASAREGGNAEHCAKEEAALAACLESLRAPGPQFPAKGGVAGIAASAPDHRAK
jgi:hypothetical protein